VAEGRGQTVSDIGEDALLERIARRVGRPHGEEVWGGDDAALVLLPGPRALVTTDLIVENLDFLVEYCTGWDVGWKAIAVNASDIAAMCGRPSHAVTTVTLPGHVEIAFFDDLLEGMLAAADRWGIALVGGDISGGREISVGVSMVGAPILDRPVLRSGARAGEAICVTGTLGAARAGLEVLRRGDRSAGTEPLVARQLRPSARVDEAASLAPLVPSAMIDLSDGLAVDLARLLTASGVGADVDAGSLPVDPDVALVAGIDPVESAILGGEDYELLFTIGAARVEEASAAVGSLGTRVTRIGTVTTGAPTLAGKPLEEWKERGWQHLRDR
jgi:thiamine-monophosphate kinase